MRVLLYAGLLLLAGCPKPGPEATLPAGSYLQSCSAKFQDDILYADCKDRNGQLVYTTLRDVSQCRTDIVNDDGRLWCRKPEVSPERVPLVMFLRAWHTVGTVPSKLVDLDYYTTTDPAWTCIVVRECIALPDPAYRAVGLVGYVFNPKRPQPPGTVPIVNWYSAALNDHFLSSDPQAWREGYVFTGIEGYVNTSPTPDGVELVNFYSGKMADNATLNPNTPYTFFVGTNMADQGVYARIRTEGYLVGPGTPAGRNCAANATPHFTSGPFPADTSAERVWAGTFGLNLIRGDALRISATGEYWSGWSRTYIDGKERFDPVTGFPMHGIADRSSPLPGAPRFEMIGTMSSGRAWVHGWGNVEAGQFFSIGGDSNCVEHTSDTISGQLVLRVNEGNLADNTAMPLQSGGAQVLVKQWR